MALIELPVIVRFLPWRFAFRFIESNFKFMIVDIQGVQDIYTDPQIHTIDGKGYGEGNLGIRGIALFFLSHR